MADVTDKLPLNVDGKFYVDSQCIDCDLCRQSAPANFERSDAEGYSYVSKQPETEDEVQDCLEALDECPVEAISMEDGVAVVNDDCVDCGACVDACPVEAITLE